MRFIIIYLLALLPAIATAQAIDKTFVYENVNSDKYLRFNYENDFFAASDRYYTQGMNLELVNPNIRKIPVSKVLLRLNSTGKYGIGIEHNGYTPTSIQNNEILYGNRPFAAALFLNFFSQSRTEKQQLSSTLSMGVIGPAAGGMEMQESIHEWTNNIDPQGWQFQIQNDLVLNYRITYDYNLVNASNNFLLNATGTLKLGTLNDKIGVGATGMAGLFDDPFAGVTTKKFKVYIYDRPLINLVGYDATMQGGLFNKSSPYTIAADDINRVVFENRAGFVVAYKRLTLEYFRSFVTKEFSTGEQHAWGGVGMALQF